MDNTRLDFKGPPKLQTNQHASCGHLFLGTRKTCILLIVSIVGEMVSQRPLAVKYVFSFLRAIHEQACRVWQQSNANRLRKRVAYS